MDVRTLFLHSILEELVYVEKPLDFEVKDRKTYVCRLKKGLYILKKSPIAWYAHIDNHPVKLGFMRRSVDPNLYFKVVQGMPLILVLYVDDIFLTWSEPLMLECKRELTSELKMKDIGLMHWFMGLEVWDIERFGIRGVATTQWDFPFLSKICCEYLGNIWNGRIKVDMLLDLIWRTPLSINSWFGH